MKKKLMCALAALALTVLTAVSPLTAQAAGGLELYTDYPGISVKAGDSESIAMHVSNESGSAVEASLNVLSMPEGWTGYFSGNGSQVSRVHVQNGAEADLTFQLQVPEDAAEVAQLEKQIFSMLEASLKLDMSNKAYREQYLVPLKMLYLYCVKEQVRDMEQMELHQAEGFWRYLEENAGGKADSYSQILGRIRKFLFLNPAKTNWNANVWYLDRFRLKGDRMNPARKVGSFHFYLIQDPENRKLFQLYMKYCIGISSRSMNRIRAEYYNIYLFLQYCDGKGIKAASLSPQEFEQFMAAEQDKPILAATCNQRLEDINHFYLYLLSRGYVSKVPFMTGLYLKKAMPVHHDRSVPLKVQGEILAHLKDFPQDLRLMYLHLWCAGLRVNEVCCLTGDAYFFRDGVAWLRVYQYKMKREKTIPIPETLYRLMQDYIRINHRLPHQYVFQGKDGQAYPAGTFCIQMKRTCKEYGISCGDYIFRAHDYRHSVATRLYDEGASLQAVRDFLGHLEEDMTRQYLDYMPAKINTANEKYFETNSLAGKLQKRKEEMEWKTVSM